MSEKRLAVIGKIGPAFGCTRIDAYGSITWVGTYCPDATDEVFGAMAESVVEGIDFFYPGIRENSRKDGRLFTEVDVNLRNIDLLQRTVEKGEFHV